MLIVFSDMDGTLLTNEKHMSDGTWAMLNELARRGIEFVPCTGRPLSGIYSDILAHPAVHYAVSANGATVSRLDPEHPGDASRATVIHNAPLSRERALDVYRISRGHDVTFDIFADGNCYLERSMYERLDEFSGGDPNIAASLKYTRTPVDETADVTIGRVSMLERVAMYWHDPTDRDAINAALAQVDDIEVTRSYPMNIEIMGGGVSKGSALTWLCDHLEIPVADAMAFGDNINDIPMIEAAGCGVAMLNAEPEDRAAADRITRADNDHDGVALTVLAALQ